MDNVDAYLNEEIKALRDRIKSQEMLIEEYRSFDQAQAMRIIKALENEVDTYRLRLQEANDLIDIMRERLGVVKVPVEGTIK